MAVYILAGVGIALIIQRLCEEHISSFERVFYFLILTLLIYLVIAGV